MNQHEERVIEAIKAHPFISQEELAELTGLTSASTADIIARLVQNEDVVGQAYVVNTSAPIVCIGAANLDRKFSVDGALVPGTSNPVSCQSSIGGVARNIAENLGRLGEKVIMLTTCGDDTEWQSIQNLSAPYMDLDGIQPIPGCATGSYTALLNAEGEMTFGLADMAVYDFLTPDFLIRRTSILKKAECIIIDLNCPRETLNFLCAYCRKNNIKLAIIPVSSPKMKHLPDDLSAVDWLIVNQEETENHLNLTLNTPQDYERACQKWLDLGVRRVLITSGAKEVVYADASGMQAYPVKPSQQVVDVTGAGDSFCAGVLYSWLKGETIEDNIYTGLANSAKTVETPYTVRQDLDRKQLEIDVEAYKHG